MNKYTAFHKFSLYWGIFWTGASLLTFIDKSDINILVQMIFLGVMPLVYGYNKKKNFEKDQKNQLIPGLSPSLNYTEIENKILLLSTKDDYSLNPTEVSINLKLDYNQATEVLNLMVKKGILSVEETNFGTVVYYNKDYSNEFELHKKKSQT